MVSGTLKPPVVWGSSSAAFESCTVKDRPVASHPAPHVCWSTSTATGSCRVAADGVNAEAAAGADKNGPLADRPLIVHGFSIGAFVWGQLMIQMTKPDAVDSAEDEGSTSTFDFTDSSSPFGTHVSAFAADAAGDAAAGNESGLKKGDKTAERTDSKEAAFRFNEVQQRITGVVLDSPTVKETMMEGVRQSITSSVLGTAFKNVLPLYLKVFSRSVGSFYTASEQAYLRNPSGLPTLIFYSDADPVSPARLLDKVVSDWQTGGVDVHVQKWEDSAHVNHFSSYPEEYKEALEVFVDLCYARIKERSAS